MKKFLEFTLTFLCVALIFSCCLVYVNRVDGSKDLSFDASGYDSVQTLPALVNRVVRSCNSQSDKIKVIDEGTISFDEHGNITLFSIKISIYKNYHFLHYNMVLEDGLYTLKYLDTTYKDSDSCLLSELLVAIFYIDADAAINLSIDTKNYYNPNLNHDYILLGKKYTHASGEQKGIYNIITNVDTLEKYYFIKK